MIVTNDIIVDFTTGWYHSTDLAQWYRCAALSWPVTQVYKVLGPYNLTLSRPAVTSCQENSWRAREGKERLTWLVSWPTQTRTQRTVKFHVDIVVEFHMTSRYKKIANDSSPNVSIAHSDFNTDALFTLSKQHGYQ